MTRERQKGTVIYFNDDFGFGYIVPDDSTSPVFFHLLSFYTKANRTSDFGDRATYFLDRDETTFNRAKSVERDTLQFDATDIPNRPQAFSQGSGNGREIDAEVNRTALVRNRDIRDAEIMDFMHRPDVDVAVFVECRFHGSANFIGQSFSAQMFFLGCSFEKRVSFKNSRIAGELHFESCDFSGTGGVSLRGLCAEAVYMDFGVKGPDDMLWLNEMNVAGPMVVSGRFNGDIQIVADQDEEKDAGTRSGIGKILVGDEYYKSQVVNRTAIDGMVRISGVQSDEIRINETRVSAIEVSDIDTNAFRICKTSVADTVQCSTSAFRGGARIIDNYLSARLVVERCRFDEDLILDGTTVEKISRIQNCGFESEAGLSVYDFVSDRVMIEPVGLLYGAGKRVAFTGKFNLLSRQKSLTMRDRVDYSERARKLSEEYTSLRRWLHDCGSLKQEDQAFFNMRRIAERNPLSKLVFDWVFGWGVQLGNVLVSSIAVIIGFAIVFNRIDGLSFSESTVLSTQSFLGVFFGGWGNVVEWFDRPTSAMIVLVNAESALGVVFVTVFIGAYMRKMLR